MDSKRSATRPRLVLQSRVIAVPVATLVLLAAWMTIAMPAGRAEDAPKRVRGEASASDQRTFQKVLKQALAEFQLGNWAEARSLFERAHELEPSARTLRAIGLCAFEGRKYVDAVLFMTQALDDPRKRLEGKPRNELQEVLERAKGFVAQYALRVAPEDASILIDLAPPVELDGKILLDPGPHALRVSAPGFIDANHQIDAKSREERELNITLVSAVAPAIAEPQSASPPTIHAGATADHRARDKPEKRRWYRNPWLWTGVGILVVGGAAAGSYFALAPGASEPEPYGGTVGTSLPGP